MSSFTISILLIALAYYQILSLQVSQARYKYGIKAPKILGHDDFERVHRTHVNFMENLVVFLPLLFIGGMKFSTNYVFIGVTICWLVSKVVFSYAYIRNLSEITRLISNVIALLSIATLFVFAILTLF